QRAHQAGADKAGSARDQHRTVTGERIHATGSKGGRGDLASVRIRRRVASGRRTCRVFSLWPFLDARFFFMTRNSAASRRVSSVPRTSERIKASARQGRKARLNI